MCSVIQKNGELCTNINEHEYNGRPLCKKHWNNGRLTKTQPLKEVKEARRKLLADKEFVYILDYVLSAIVKNKRMTYRKMAQMANSMAKEAGHLNKKERNDLVKLIITSVRLRRECTPANEMNAIRAIGTMIMEICEPAQ
jgi:hypothetical protein